MNTHTTAIHTTPTPTTSMTSSAASPTASPALRDKILRTIERKSFCTLATTSPAGRSHSAGVVYDAVDGTLWIHTMAGSRKARSIAANPEVGVCIPFRRLPVGPPFTIHFQATAEIAAMDDPEVRRLLDAGELGSISGHGALDMPDGCFVAIRPKGTIHSYGLGARTIDLIRDPLNTGARSFRLDERAGAQSA